VDDSDSERGEKKAPMTDTIILTTDVMRYYVKCELGKVVRDWEQTQQFVKSFDLAIDALDRDEMSRLAVALSYYYRRNALCTLWSKYSEWQLRTIPSSHLLMSGINPSVNPTLEKFNLAKFVQYLKGEGANDINLAEFRESHKIWYPSIIGEESGTMTQIFDGSHRAVSLVSKGQELSCYVPTRKAQKGVP
jgi:hypothetical protein